MYEIIANIDDMSSEVYSYIYDKILREGALDIYTESIYMKKNRPATKLNVICEEKNLEKFIDIIIKETSTFGVRYNKYNRVKLHREFKKLKTPYGDIRIKLGYYCGKLIKVTPEYEDCKNIAQNNELSLNQFLYKINYMINEEFDINLLT